MRTRTLEHPLAFEVRGTGQPLLLLHGLGADRDVWREVHSPLSAGRQVVALDLLGFGQSAKPSTELRLRDLADSVIELLDELSFASVDVMGNSLGGWLALFLAVAHPERVRSVVAVAPAFLYGLPETVTAEALARGANPREEDAARRYLARALKREATPDDVVSLLRRRLSADDSNTIESLARSIERGEDLLVGKLEDVTQPVLVVHGVADGVVPQAQSERVASEALTTQLMLLEASGHWPQIEEPELFTKAATEFLR